MRHTDRLRAPVVLLVFLHDEQVHRDGSHGVEEGEDSNGDKEFSRGGVVSLQEETLWLLPPTGGYVKVDLVQPMDRKDMVRFKGCFTIMGRSHQELQL